MSGWPRAASPPLRRSRPAWVLVAFLHFVWLRWFPLKSTTPKKGPPVPFVSSWPVFGSLQGCRAQTGSSEPLSRGFRQGARLVALGDNISDEMATSPIAGCDRKPMKNAPFMDVFVYCWLNLIFCPHRRGPSCGGKNILHWNQREAAILDNIRACGKLSFRSLYVIPSISVFTSNYQVPPRPPANSLSH